MDLTATHLTEEIRMANDQQLFTLHPTPSSEGGVILTDSPSHLAAWETAADQAGRTYTISEAK